MQRLTFIATRRSLENLPFHFLRPLPDLREKSRIRGGEIFPPERGFGGIFSICDGYFNYWSELRTF